MQNGGYNENKERKPAAESAAEEEDAGAAARGGADRRDGLSKRAGTGKWGETVRKPLRGDNRILNVGLSPKQS